MGRARGGRVRGLTSMVGGILRRRIESVDNYANVDQLIGHLRSTYPQYARLPLRIFTKRVHQILHSSGKANDDVSDGSNIHEQKETIPRKKRKEFDESEVKLRDKRRNNVYAAVSSSGSVDSSEDWVTTSGGDGIDLTNSNLRENYRNISKKSGGVEGNREVVVVNTRGEDGTEFGEGKVGDELGALNNDDDNRPKFKDLGGLSEVICRLIEELVVPFCRPDVMQHLGLEPMGGILLHGPPGCGKTTLAHAIANEAGVRFYKISATELVSGVSGGSSEENIRDLFAKAYRTAPSIIFIDEIDVIASKRENLLRETDRRIVTQLMTCIDETNKLVKPVNGNEDSETSNSRPGHVLVIGATNRPDAIDPALRRPGRFDCEFVLGVPDEKARVEMLKVLTRNLKVEGALDLKKVARSTPGFVGADLAALVKKAGILAMKRILSHKKDVLSGEYHEDLWRHPWPHEELDKLSITIADFEDAVEKVQPSSKREGFSVLPNVKWDEVGGLHSLKQVFDHHITKRIKFPEYFEHFGVGVDSGILLYGPPGCGKTLIAKAVACEAGANFIYIKGPELLNKYVGESELAVRTIFMRARTCSPCILFFDEVDALTTDRDREGGRYIEKLVDQLLVCLDAAEQRQGVYVIAATNRPEAMDPALLRPGRFEELLYVPLPCPEERGMILKSIATKMKIDASVDLMAIGKDSSCENFSGADLFGLLRKATSILMEDIWASLHESSVDYSLFTVKDEHINRALKQMSPSVSEERIQHYESLSKSLPGSRKVNASNTFIKSFS
ncbi:cell division control protein 48 homolog C-like [Primulina tabacum]|uniref:cell division control protein 48 homolog C-like n=1 Tax=Primulina tabacum TaxID=48773 RepID=UPI003F5AC7C3